MIESKYDKVYTQRTDQPEIFRFVEGKHNDHPINNTEELEHE